jgi:hypothetical protein
MGEGEKSGIYKVPKRRARVLVKMPPSPPAWKSIFLSSSAASHQGAETVSDLFNASQLFLPLREEEGEVTIVRRAAIRWIRVEDPKDVEWYYYEIREGVARATVEFRFDDGELLEGTLYALGRAGEQRVLDVVNRREDDFLHLEAKEGLFLVNLGHISSISVSEEEDGGA